MKRCPTEYPPMSDSVPWDEELRVQAAGGGGGQDRKERSRTKETAGQSLRKGKPMDCEYLCVFLQYPL